MRPWGGSQYQTIRNPKDPGWPSSGERTEDRDTAESWKWDLVALYRGEARDRQRGVERAPPLGEKLDEYIRHRERTRAPTTVSSNNAALQALLQKFGEGKPVDRITTKGLQTLFDDMQAQGYAPSTMRTNLASMSTFFNWLGIDNPTKGVELPSDDDTEDIYAWSDADLTRLRNAADRLGYRQWFELALNTGTRKNELLALRWEDINPRTKTVRIVRQFQKGTTKPRGLKGKKARTAIILPGWWDHHAGGHGYIVTRDGEPVNDRVLHTWVLHLLNAAGLNGPGRGIHDARRTYGRLFLEAGGWMDELQRSLGHSTIKLTERHYGAFQAEVAADFARQRIYGEGRLRLLS